jgi:hypothetical protein
MRTRTKRPAHREPITPLIAFSFPPYPQVAHLCATCGLAAFFTAIAIGIGALAPAGSLVPYQGI